MLPLVESPGYAFAVFGLGERMVKKATPIQEPRRSPADTFWTRWGRVMTVVVPAILLIAGTIYQVLDRRIDRLDDRLTGQFDRLDGRLRGVETGIVEIRTQLKYGPHATALGFKNPAIKVVPLTQKTAFTASETVSGVFFDLTYTIVQIERDHMTIRVDGRVANMRLDNLVVTVPFKVGELTPIRAVAAPGVPTIYLAILDKIPPNQAVVAIGS